ncbi:carbohydrate-binding module family 18 protein [Piromyces sp. E2]|nr:carbohydrate-binding module family 18 protein [Piromyces sp. E2]|eukprot:OUM64771.1 carbohydrate-binding module family 18 protein [Piromyces sp. E2]
MKNNNKILFFLLNSILLINIIFAKSVNTSSDGGEIISKKGSKDQKYVIFVNNTFGEYNIFSNPYNKKHVKRQEVQSYDFAVSLMDEIDELINENRDTFKDQEKLEEIDNQSKLRKRDSDDKTGNYYDNSSFVHPVSSQGSSLLISAYLSEELAKKIEKMDNVEAVVPDIEITPDANYYNKNDILKESEWKGLSVQGNADLHLSVISQGLYNNKLVGQYDENYYYPSSAGKGIDIIVIDSGFNFDYSEYSNTERTAKCSVVFNSDGKPTIPKNKKVCGSTQYFHGHKVADIAAGLKRGIAKSANIYGVAIPVKESEVFDVSYVVEALDYLLKNNMIRPNKTIINISLGGYSKKVNGNLSNLNLKVQELVKTIINKGGVVVASAGNNGKNVDKGSEVYVPCYIDNIICVGGIQSDEISSVTNKYVKSAKSNYGKRVDIYAPYNVHAEFNENGKIKRIYGSGTSYSTPLTAGIIATIMSDNPNTKFTKKSILNYLLNDGISFNVEGLTKKVINNGKHIVYSSNGKYKGCGINAGNQPCSNSSNSSKSSNSNSSKTSNSSKSSNSSKTSNTIPVSTVKARCGPEYGRCANSNECCSQYGWCDTTSAHCGTGCQPKYGICK